MFEIDLKSRKTIYEQVVDNIKELILVGVIGPDQKIPSVRDLSKTLTVNPNTVQKAYSELERLGYIYSVSGRGTFANKTEDINKYDKEVIDKASKNIASEIKELLYMGFDKDYITKLLNKLLENESLQLEQRRPE